MAKQLQKTTAVLDDFHGVGGGGGGGGSSSSSGSRSPRKKSQEASKKHALAEQKRRERINRHYDRLRQLFPNLSKTDKATVLTETVKQVKELRKKMDECMAATHRDEDGERAGKNGSWPLFLPSERDEVKVSYCHDKDIGVVDRRMVKATVCCEDRPGLNGDLTEAVKSVKGRVIKAEMATIGGRTKAEMVVQWCNEGGGGGGEEDVGSLRRALKAVVENRALGCSILLGQRLPRASWSDLAHEMPVGKRARVCGSISDECPLSDGLLLHSA